MWVSDARKWTGNKPHLERCEMKKRKRAQPNRADQILEVLARVLKVRDWIRVNQVQHRPHGQDVVIRLERPRVASPLAADQRGTDRLRERIRRVSLSYEHHEPNTHSYKILKIYMRQFCSMVVGSCSKCVHFVPIELLLRSVAGVQSKSICGPAMNQYRLRNPLHRRVGCAEHMVCVDDNLLHLLRIRTTSTN